MSGRFMEAENNLIKKVKNVEMFFCFKNLKITFLFDPVAADKLGFL